MELLKNLELYTTSPSFQALLTRDKDNIQDKYKSNEHINGHDASALYGNLYFIINNNMDILEECGLNPIDVLNDASISDNKLYLNNFEGYELSERLSLQAIYFNQYNCTIGMVYDNKIDKYIYFIFD